LKTMYVSCLVLENIDEPDVETRVSVFHGLAIVCETLTGVAIDSTMSVPTSDESLLDVIKVLMWIAYLNPLKTIQFTIEVMWVLGYGKLPWRLLKKYTYIICQSLTIFVGHGIHITQEYTLNEGFISSIQ